MKILLTGASSFTGYHICKELAKAGHNVYPTFTKSNAEAYTNLYKERVLSVLDFCHDTCFWNVEFGSQNFLNILREEQFDVIIHHAAIASLADNANLHFDVMQAVTKNTLNIRHVIAAAKLSGTKKFVLTSSYYENGFSNAKRPGYDLDDRAVSPYGLSKSLSRDIIKYYCDVFQLPFLRIVVPNPFGVLENEKFTTKSIKSWAQNKPVVIAHPDYVRDNINVELLAKYYVYCIANYNEGSYYPSGIVSPQGRFARIFAKEMKDRLNIETPIVEMEDVKFSYMEPKFRYNTEPAILCVSDWDQNLAWDNLAKYYTRYLNKS